MEMLPPSAVIGSLELPIDIEDGSSDEDADTDVMKVSNRCIMFYNIFLIYTFIWQMIKMEHIAKEQEMDLDEGLRKDGEDGKDTGDFDNSSY